MWMINNQKDRRNWPVKVRLKYAFEYEDLYKQAAKERQGTRTDLLPENKNISATLHTSEAKGRTLEKIAKEAGCGYRTAYKYKKLRDAGLMDEVNNNSQSITKHFKSLQAEGMCEATAAGL